VACGAISACGARPPAAPARPARPPPARPARGPPPAGARGPRPRPPPAAELADAIRRVHRGERAVAPELAAEAWAETDPLTERERQVLRLAGDGKSSAAIGAALHLAEGTVRNYLSEAISKLGAANRIDAARIARQKGWL
jgi:two-component system, NarL family, response regulator DesR